MKTIRTILFSALLFPLLAQAQSAADIFSTSKTVMTYIGLDFSRVQLVGPSGFNDPQAIKEEYFDKWNNLVLEESDKYDLKRAFLKERMDFNLNPVQERNDQVDFANLVINQTAPTLNAAQLQDMVNQYDLNGISNPISLVFIVESLDKVAELGTFHVVFLNTQTKQIIFTDKVTGEPSGFGFRNYWAGAFYDALKAIKSKKWNQWKKKSVG